MAEQTENRGLVMHLPEDEALLAGLARVAIRHSQLDFILRRTVKTLTGLSVAEADRALQFQGSRSLRDLIRKIARRKLGKDSTALLKLKAILARCEQATDERNPFVHNIWAKYSDGEPVLYSQDKQRPQPTADELNRLAEEIRRLTDELNEARLTGFLQQALLPITEAEIVKWSKGKD